MLALFLVALPGAVLARESAIAFEGGTVVLGRADEVTATVHLGEEEDGQPLPLRLSASVGSFGEAQRVRAGEWSVRYRPPATRFPQIAIAALWREGGPLQVEFLRFPLHGTTRLPVKASPGSRVTVEVAGRSFGPVEAGADGLAVVPLVVPPGAREAVANVRGQIGATLKAVKLEAPDGNRLLAVVLRPPNTVGNRLPARLLVVYDPEVPGFDRRRIAVKPSQGTATWEKSDGHLHGYRWTPPERLEGSEVTFDVEVEGDPAARYRTALALASPLPRKKELVAPRWGGESIIPAAPAPAPRPSAAPVPLPPPPPSTTLLPPPPPEAPPPATSAVDPPPPVLLVGTRAGYADGLENRLGPRAGLELWASPPPARLPLGLPLGVGLALSMGDVTAPATAAGGGWRGSLLPLALRLAWEQRVGSSFVGRAGAAAVAAWLRARTDAGSASGFGLGYGAFASAALAMRRGELLAELSYGRTPVPTPLGRVEASGLCLELGLRVGVF